MPTTLNEKIFLIYSIIFGLLIGLMLTTILENIALPDTTAYLLTIQEQHDFTTMAARSLGDSLSSTVWVVGLVNSLIYYVLLLTVLNPQINTSLLKHPKKILRLGVWIIATLVITIGLASRLDAIFGDMNITLFMKISGVALPIVWWAMLGEIGIAGDLSSWKPQSPDIRTCTLLAISAYLLFIVLQLANSWGFAWFYILVSEVLDGTGEFSLRGFAWLRGGLVFLSVCSAATASAIIIGFAPIKIERHKRIDKLVLPVGMLIIFSIILTGGYYIGVMKYDLGQSNLSETIQAEQPHNTLIHTAILQGDPIVSRPWNPEITPTSMGDYGQIYASTANIAKLHHYLNDQPQSIFRHAAEDAIVKSWFGLWQSDQATLSQQQTQNDIIQRLVLLNRLAHLPITPENRQFLDQYEDESKWWVGRKAALLLAEAALHFNEFSKARQWLNLAKERGATEEHLSGVTIPAQHQLVTGVISGKINSEQPVTVAVFRAKETGQQVELDTTFLSLNMVQSQDVGSDANFSFTALGTGRYFLAVKYEGNTVPISMEYLEGIELSLQHPTVDVGLIRLGATAQLRPML